MVEAQGIDAKELKAEGVFIKMGKETLELTNPQITVIRILMALVIGFFMIVVPPLLGIYNHLKGWIDAKTNS